MIATPVRFTAMSITRPVALDVGRVVFAALNKAELAGARVLLLVIVRVIRSARRELWAWCSVLVLIVLAQGAWLIPELAAQRTDIILAGGEPPPSFCARGVLVAGTRRRSGSC